MAVYFDGFINFSASGERNVSINKEDISYLHLKSLCSGRSVIQHSNRLWYTTLKFSLFNTYIDKKS
jgi:hypothetical protein